MSTGILYLYQVPSFFCDWLVGKENCYVTAMTKDVGEDVLPHIFTGWRQASETLLRHIVEVFGSIKTTVLVDLQCL